MAPDFAGGGEYTPKYQTGRTFYCLVLLFSSALFRGPGRLSTSHSTSQEAFGRVMMSERRAAAVMPASRPGSPVPVGGEREQAAFPYTAPFHILLVEDDSMTLMCVEKLLLRCGYSVTATSSPKLALSILASAACVPGARHVDLILTGAACYFSTIFSALTPPSHRPD